MKLKNVNPIATRIRCLDGLRALAISLVFLSHLQHSGAPLWLKNVASAWAPGNVGVRLFFLLSGFLITHILNLELQRTGKINFKKFFIRRVLRIFPAFYFYLVTLVLLSYTGIITIDFHALLFASFYVQNFNVLHLEGWWLVAHAWSLSVEEQFYLIFPFVLHKIRMLLHSYLVKLMLVMTLICSLFRISSLLSPRISLLTGGVFFMYCDYFFYGGVLAIYIWDARDRLRKLLDPFRYWLLLLALVTPIYSSKVEFYSSLNILIFGNLIVFSIIYVLLFFLLFPDSIIGNLLEQKTIRMIGTLSYSLYVWQQLFLGAADNWSKFKSVTLFPYNLLFVIICAFCSYWFIEKPFLRIKKRYEAYS